MKTRSGKILRPNDVQQSASSMQTEQTDPGEPREQRTTVKTVKKRSKITKTRNGVPKMRLIVKANTAGSADERAAGEELGDLSVDRETLKILEDLALKKFTSHVATNNVANAKGIITSMTVSFSRREIAEFMKRRNNNQQDFCDF